MKPFLYVFVIFSVLVALSGCSGKSLQVKDIFISPQRELVNYALASMGATAESSDNNPEHPASEVIDGDTSSLDWDNGGGWEGSLSHLRLDDILKRSYIQVNMPGKKQVKKIVVYTIDSPKYPAGKFGLNTYRLEYWHGTGWEKITFANDSIDKQFTTRENKAGRIVYDVEGELMASKIRLVPRSSNDTVRTYSLTAYGGKTVYDVSGAARVIEIEVWCYPTNHELAGLEEPANLLPAGERQLSPDEQDIVKILDNYEQGYDNENLEQVMSGFSEDFLTTDGKTKIDIQEKAASFFMEYSGINITLRDQRIHIGPTGETATAEVNYTLDCVANADNNSYRRSGSLTFSFRKEADGNWRILNAE